MQTSLNAVQKKSPVFYRDDIDGLRAIAVVSVMLYHFIIGPFTGGFVGVDIFFVISGYLITSGIVKQAEAGKFNFPEFYVRRARRLFPALLFTILLTYIAAFFLFSPVDFANMSGSTVFALTGLSNIFFWMESDYFDLASIVKPLLHTWSLSVELQFYLVWPAILLFIIKYGKKITGLGVILVTGAGLISAIYALKHDATGAFYLTQYRFHEFSIGGIVFLVGRSKLVSMKYYMPNLFFIVGSAMVFYSIFSFTSHTHFPGSNALIPVVGAALMILSGDKSKLSKILSIRPVSYVGEISYSLYLIHWPLFVFAQYIMIRDLSDFERSALVMVTFASAILMHRFIEKPFRDTKIYPMTGPAFSLACACIAMSIMLPASSSWANRGWVWRLPEQVRQINNFDLKALENYVWDKQVKLASEKQFSNNGKEKLLIIGDSQSADIVNILNESRMIDKYDIVARTVSYECGAPYVSKEKRGKYWGYENQVIINSPQLIPSCEKQMDSAIDANLLSQADKIFISMKWESYSTSKIQEAINKISSLTSAKIYIFGNKTLSKSSIDLVNAFGRVNGVDKYASEFRNPSSDDINKQISLIKGATFVDMMNIICPEKDSCHVLTKELKPVFFDPAHLTREGAIFLSADFSGLLSKLTINKLN